jgi:hypothetical protein
MSFDAAGPKGMMKRIGRDGYPSAESTGAAANAATTMKACFML